MDMNTISSQSSVAASKTIAVQQRINTQDAASTAPSTNHGGTTSFSVVNVAGAAQYRSSSSSTIKRREKDDWTCLSAPCPLTLTLVYHGHVDQARTEAQTVTTMTTMDADATTEARPVLLIQSEQQKLEQLYLDAATLKSTKLQGIMKGPMVGFRYRHLSAGSSASTGFEVRKFQVKFRSATESGQCASMLSPYIECRPSKGGAIFTPTSGAVAATAVGTQSILTPPAATSSLDVTTASESSLIESNSAALGNRGMEQSMLSQQSTFFERNSQENAVFQGTQDMLCTPNGVIFRQAPPPSMLASQQQHSPQQGLQSCLPIGGSHSTPICLVQATDSSATTSTLATHSLLLLQRQRQQQHPQHPAYVAELNRLLGLPNQDLQDEINMILVDPMFSELLVKIEQEVRILGRTTGQAA
ncbi:hypothetical protein EDD11_007172 [Mortierella claussenii]|nr:hypothetical protein EDD11_007172 [Mortierella claussenii]